MGNYTITTGQNLYDIAMHIHGSIEGIVDLMINNSELSLDDKLQAGAQLIYTDEYVINGDIVAYNTSHMTIPASGEQHVYYKSSDYPQILELILDNKKHLQALFSPVQENRNRLGRQYIHRGFDSGKCTKGDFPLFR